MYHIQGGGPSSHFFVRPCRNQEKFTSFDFNDAVEAVIQSVALASASPWNFTSKRVTDFMYWPLMCPLKLSSLTLHYSTTNSGAQIERCILHGTRRWLPQ